jgi:hypothetical protein
MDNKLPKLPGLITPASPEFALAHKFLLAAGANGAEPLVLISACAIAMVSGFVYLKTQFKPQVLDNVIKGLRAEVLGEKVLAEGPLPLILPPGMEKPS